MSIMDRLLAAIANIVGFLVLVPYRVFARKTEDWITRQRRPDWRSSFMEQRLLDLATQTAIDQSLRFNAHPVAAEAALRFARHFKVG